MLRIRRDHELPRLHGQSVIFSHNRRYPFVVHSHAAAPQLSRDPAITVPPAMFHRDLLNRRPHFHLLLDRPLFLQRAIEPRPTYRYQLTHALDTQAALPRHHFPDLVVDVVSPELLLRWRRASTFCKAPLKKSTSIVFSASKRFH